MDLMILRKKIDGFRLSNGTIRDVSPEVLWELRQAWEHFTGPIEQFRSKLGIKRGTLRILLISAKKLNHAMASADRVLLQEEIASPTDTATPTQVNHIGPELIYDKGEKVIRFPDVNSLIEFLKRAA